MKYHLSFNFYKREKDSQEFICISCVEKDLFVFFTEMSWFLSY